jgi:hypothetical protein
VEISSVVKSVPTPNLFVGMPPGSAVSPHVQTLITTTHDQGNYGKKRKRDDTSDNESNSNKETNTSNKKTSPGAVDPASSTAMAVAGESNLKNTTCAEQSNSDNESRASSAAPNQAGQEQPDKKEAAPSVCFLITAPRVRFTSSIY